MYPHHSDGVIPFYYLVYFVALYCCEFCDAFSSTNQRMLGYHSNRIHTSIIWKLVERTISGKLLCGISNFFYLETFYFTSLFFFFCCLNVRDYCLYYLVYLLLQSVCVFITKLALYWALEACAEVNLVWFMCLFI